MVGSVTDSCDFEDCQYKTNGQYYVAASFSSPPDTIGTSDPTEWDLHYLSGTSAFSVWDLNRQ
jgi:hypothetical protein